MPPSTSISLGRCPIHSVKNHMLEPPGTFITPVEVKFGVKHRIITIPVSPIVTRPDCRGMLAGTVPHYWTPQQMQLLLALMCHYSVVHNGGANSTIVYPALIDVSAGALTPRLDLLSTDITIANVGGATCPVLFCSIKRAATVV